MAQSDLRFSKDDMHAALMDQNETVSEAVRTIDPDTVLLTPVADLVGEFYERFRVNPVELKLEERTSSGAKDLTIRTDDWSGGQVNVDGTRVEILIPFSGDTVLRNVAAPVAYQDVGGSGSGCSCVVGETGPDDNRRLGGDRRRRSFDLQPGRCGLVDEHPVRAGHCPQLGHDGCLEGDPLVESHLHVGGRFEWYSGFDQIELDSQRASLGHIRTERRNRRRFRRHQRLTPVVALRIHSPEVRS